MPMIYQLYEPYALNEKGKRSNNEDSIFPKKGEATSDTRVFLVCDGVGGQAKGEIASKIVSEYFGNALYESKISEKDFIESLLHQIEDELQNYTMQHTESVGMATTLTMVHFHEDGVSVVHIGDSRIYQIRNGQIIYKSEDHSFVNELIKAGVISPEQAANHPQRNVITRAIQGSDKRVETETFVLQDIAPNDYFFLCTDGILESVNDAMLVNILTNPLSNKEKINEILTLCENKSRDNFSCYLLQVAECHGTPNFLYENNTVFNTIALNTPTNATIEGDNNAFDEPITTFQPKYAAPTPISEPIAAISNVADNQVDYHTKSMGLPTVESLNEKVISKSNTFSKWIAVSFIVMALAGGGTWYFLNQNIDEMPKNQEIESQTSEPIQIVNEPQPVLNTLDTNLLLDPSVLNKKNGKNETQEPVINTENNHKEAKQPENKMEVKPQEGTKDDKSDTKNKIKNLENDVPLGNTAVKEKKQVKDPKSISNKTSEVVNNKKQ